MQFDLDLAVPPKTSRTIVRDLHRQLREAILAGRLLPGAQLPPSREFSAQYGVSRSTAMAVYDLLLSEGFLVARQGAGTFVAEKLRRPSAPSVAARQRRDPRLPRRAAAPSDDFATGASMSYAFDLRMGLPDKSAFPFDTWRRLSNHALRDLGKQPAAYLDPAGPEPFRNAISTHVSFTRAVACNAESIVATTGAQQAFDIIARALVESGKTVVAVEDPGYPPLRAAFESAGATVQPVPVDGEGMIIEKLPKNARIICVTPSHQFPTGVVMSLARRNSLLDFARRNGAVIVEDDYDSEFRFGGNPLDALQTLDRDGSVFYVGTFSKSLFPALRLGFVAVPEWARDAIVAAKRVADWHSPALPQLALASFIAEGHLVRHVRRMRKIYRKRRATLETALAVHTAEWLTPVPSAAGLHLSAWFKGSIDEAKLQAACAANGVGVERISTYAMNNARARVSLSATEPARMRRSKPRSCASQTRGRIFDMH